MLEAATIENFEPDVAADRRDGMDECGDAPRKSRRSFEASWKLIEQVPRRYLER